MPDQTPDRLIRAPWTPEQVAALNAFQQRGGMHPFTCGGDHAPGSPVLVAHEDGWRCSDPYREGCDYRQDWAHAFMVDRGAAVSSVGQAPTPDRTALLSDAERTMLTYALDQAQENIWSEGGFTDEDQTAVDSLRRMADVPAAVVSGRAADETQGAARQMLTRMRGDAATHDLGELLRLLAVWAASSEGRDALIDDLIAAGYRLPHACGNCDGIDPDTCLMNPDRPKKPPMDPVHILGIGAAEGDPQQPKQIRCDIAISTRQPHAAHDWTQRPDGPTRHCPGAGAQQPTGADRTVAYRLPASRELHCLACTPTNPGNIWTPVTAEDLEDGGLCFGCGIDVLIEQPKEDRP